MMVVKFNELRHALRTILTLRETRQHEDIFVYVEDRLVYAAYYEQAAEFLCLTHHEQVQMNHYLLDHWRLAS